MKELPIRLVTASLAASLICVAAATSLRAQPQLIAGQLAALTPLALTNCQSPGNYYLLYGPYPEQPWPPLPSPPLDVPGDTPCYDFGSGIFLIDDAAVDWSAVWQQEAINSALEQARAAESVTNGMVAALGGSLLSPLDLSSYTGLWLEIASGGVDETNLNAIVHNTFEGQAYTALTTEDLSAASWAEEQLFYGTNGDSTPVQLARNGRTNLFVWARDGVPSTTLAIVSEPLDQDVLLGDTVTFSVVATGSGTLSYQWACNGTDIPGATTTSYTINNVQGGDQVPYGVTVSNGVTSVSSRTALLTVEAGTGDPLLMFVQGPRQDYCFRDGVTYWVGPGVELYGTTTLRGNSVLKFDWYSYTNSGLVVKGALVCDTQPYAPAILTSIDDNSQGQALWDEYASPQPAANSIPYLNLDAASSSVISNLRICFADLGVTTPVSPRELDVWDCQFYQCNIAIANQVWGFGARDVLHNVLFANCGAAIGASTNSVEIEAEHVTADVTSFWAAPSPPYKVALTNSIILGTLGDSLIAFTQNVALNPSRAVFQSAAQGNYYLAPGCALHQAGAASISPTLAAEFTQKTTYGPVALAPYLQVSGDMTLSPQVPRYTGGAPDLGYWYDALDFTVAHLTVAGGTVRVLPGTAIAVWNEYVPADDVFTQTGFWVQQGSAVVSHGTPNQPIVYTAVRLVQETPATEFSGFLVHDGRPWSVRTFVPDCEPDGSGSPAPTLDFRFCNFYLPPQDYHFWAGYSKDCRWEASPDSSMYWTLQDCTVRGGQICLGLSEDEEFVFGPGAVAWNNCLFDQVTITLNPTWYWYYGVINCDLAFEAYNNLFRGGLPVYLEPIPAAGGNWVLKDNLFDKVEFWQDTAQPLDHANNGYWPLLASELRYSDTASRLLPTNSLSDQVLGSAPPYQAGPFGGYYLPNSTPLFGAGSRSVSDAGVFHYTTRVDQMKEGEETSGHMVNIGPHYVATASAGSAVPRDTDGDGIPDYVENWHGDGAYTLHTDTETDWHNSYTVAGVYDPTNSLYDTVDLDGDGLTGLLERFLGTDPLASDNPLALPPFQAGNGLIDIPLGISPAAVSNGALRVYLNGHEPSCGDIVQAADGAWHLQLDTSPLPNGSYFLQLGLSYAQDFQHWQTALGSPCMVQVSNVVTVYELSTFFSGVLHIEAGVNVAADSYEIDISDPDGNLLKTLTGAPQNGWISDSWDLTDGNGNVIVSTSLLCDFYVSSNSGSYRSSDVMSPHSSTSQAARVRYKMRKPITGRSFAVASNGERFPNLRQVVSDNVVTDLRAGEGFSGADYNLLPSGFNDPYSDNSFVWYGGTNSNKGTLTNALADANCGNFYWMGHGGPNSIGATTNAGWGDTLSSRETRALLINWGPTPWNTNLIWNWHPYRLAILDGCATWSKEWSSTWGVPLFQTNTIADYAQMGLDPCAYVGWSAIQTNTLSNAGGNAYGSCLNELFRRWYIGQTLADCMTAYTGKLMEPANKQYLINFESWHIAGCTNLTSLIR